MYLTKTSEQPAFGALLRDVRRARRLSQFELALNAEISQRHLSFLESGRSQPSRAMVLQIAQALGLPLHERNRMLISAGYAGAYPRRHINASDMRPVRQALEMLLHHHEPFPAIVIDRSWNVLMENAAVNRVFGQICDLQALWHRVCGDGPRNALRLMMHPEGLQAYICNFADVGSAILARVAQEALRSQDVAAVLDEVLRFPGVPQRWRTMDLARTPAPVIATEYAAGDRRLRLFTTLTTFGTPLDQTADDLRVEHFFPADTGSEALIRESARHE